ncbi:MAG: lipopolysaccharide biosynthesis protein [Alloprevotella sp.]|nr:lipopolysaccharide biosynthesis protein [Alloprevotella sp.]
MANLSSLAKDTAIYGLSSIIGRFLNYLLVPLYTFKMAAQSGDYGIVTNIYSYIALLLVILTFGMETTFFRYVNKEEENPQTVYRTTLTAVGSVGLLFVALVLVFLSPIAGALGHEAHPQFLGVMAAVVAMDAFQCIPFAYLRYQRKPLRFAMLKLLFIALNIGLNLLYFLVVPELYDGPDSWVAPLLKPGGAIDVGYVFYINLVCTSTVMLFFYKELRGWHFQMDRDLLRKMLKYAWPILVLGIAGILNQTADKIIYPLIRPGHEGSVELGIYGASVKIAMIMALITQAFRYAYEPFVFGKAKDKDSKDTYAKAMKYFLIFTLLAFLVVMAYIDVLKYIVGPTYWEGLRVVPIVMAAEIMMGVYFNLSFWYKLTDRTGWGAIFSGIGCAVLIVVNLLFIPTYHYMACAWAGGAGYGTAMLLSYLVGQRYYPIRYPLRDILVYVALTALFFGAMLLVPANWPLWTRLLINTTLILAFVGHVVYHDFPLHALPVVGKYFRKPSAHEPNA